MANNCLVTKLKGIVNNPNLPKLGFFELYTTYALTKSILYITPSRIKGHTGNVIYYINDTEVSEENLSNYTTFSYNFKVSMDAGATLLIDKYETIGIDSSELGIKWLDDYCALRRFRSNRSGDQGLVIKDLKSNILIDVTLLSSGETSNYVGSYKDVANYIPNVERFSVEFTRAINFDGTIADVAELANLHTIIDVGNARYMQNKWTSPNLRPSEYPIIALPPFATGWHWMNRDDAKNFIINMANCQPSDLCLDKQIAIGGLDGTDPDVIAAIETLNEKGYTVLC